MWGLNLLILKSMCISSPAFDYFVIFFIIYLLNVCQNACLNGRWKNNIFMLIDTCTICHNVNNVKFGVMILHLLPNYLMWILQQSTSQIIFCIAGRFNSFTCKSLYGSNIFFRNSLYVSKVDQWLWLKFKFHHAYSQLYLPLLTSVDLY